MDEALIRRLVGLLTIAIAAFMLSWLLPRPGLQRLQGDSERVVTMDLTRPDSLPEEAEPGSDEETPETGIAASGAGTVSGTEYPGRDGPSSPPTDIAPAPVPPVKATDLDPAPSEPEPVVPIVLPTPDLQAAPKPDAKKAESKPVAKPITKPESKPTPKPESKPEPKSEAKPVPKPESKPTANPAAEAPVQKPSSAPPAVSKPPVAASASGSVAVQAGAYSHLDKAESVRGKAAAAGVNCVISPAETAKGTLYRLRCGPYADRAKADAAIKTLATQSIAAQVMGAGR